MIAFYSGMAPSSVSKSLPRLLPLLDLPFLLACAWRNVSSVDHEQSLQGKSNGSLPWPTRAELALTASAAISSELSLRRSIEPGSKKYSWPSWSSESGRMADTWQPGSRSSELERKQAEWSTEAFWVTWDALIGQENSCNVPSGKTTLAVGGDDRDDVSAATAVASHELHAPIFTSVPMRVWNLEKIYIYIDVYTTNGWTCECIYAWKVARKLENMLCMICWETSKTMREGMGGQGFWGWVAIYSKETACEFVS